MTQAAARFVEQGALVENIVEYLTLLDTFKIFPFVALLCAVALRQARRVIAVRTLLEGMLAGICALALTRVVQNIGPPRLRPAFLPEFDAPAPLIHHSFSDWSSFPSDTAALAFAIAVVVLRYDRLLGSLALGWAILISMARLVAAYHYPSDLVAGAVIGTAFALLFTTDSMRRLIVAGSTKLLESAPTLSSLLLVALLFQTATMFEDVRRGAEGLLRHAGLLKEQAPPPKVTTKLP